jgi:succinate-semialdehyde dehydrogenase/glutarate-semialdehyde dehydrogenase
VLRADAEPIFISVLTSDFKVGSDRDIRIGTEHGVDGGRIDDPVRPHIDGGPSGGSGQRLTLMCPSTGESFATVACAGPEDVHHAVDSAARCWTLWRGTPFSERGRRLRQLAALIQEQRHGIAQLIAREQGKPYLEALTMEVMPALDHLRFIIHHAERYHAGLAVEPRHPFFTHKHAHYLYDPIGVVALVTPSPMPFAAPLIQVAAALAMGNAAVLKPSERTPLGGLRIGELCTQAGFPAGLVNVVPAVPENTMHLVLHPKVDKVFVTGSLEVGQSIMAMAGCAVRPVVLSLGGNHPSIVAGDADVERAARGIVWGALANCGQNCGSVERVYVVERSASLFMDCLLEAIDRVNVGDPLEAGADVGPLLSAERRESVHRQVEEAAAAGAKVVRGGKIPDGPGFFYPPTIVLDPPSDARLMHEETLGPVIPVVVTESLERAMMLANDTEYALTASGWTKSPRTAERMMVGLQAGVVTINDVLYSYGEPASTWSGYRKSGMGQNHGTPGLREMSRQRFVSFDPSRAEAPLFSFPYDEPGYRMVEASLEYLNRRGWFGKVRALFRLVRFERFRRRTPLRGLLGATRRHV